MQEIYKDILGYENLYQVSNLGNVKSLPKSDGNGNRERLLKLEVCARNHTSYYRVSLSKNGVVNRYQVHQLVAQAFIQNLDGKPLVNHIDNNGQNNIVSNLEWCTHIENMQHSAIQGRQDTPRSLGGIAAAAVREKTYDTLNTSLIGTTVGELTILSYFRDNTLKKTTTPKFVCRCSCGNITTKIKGNLFNPARPKMCNECSFILRKHKDKDIVNTI